MLPNDFFKITYYHFYSSLALKSMQIVLFGDLHLGNSVSFAMTKSLFRQIQKLQPHYVCLMGDHFDSPDQIQNTQRQKQFIDLLSSLSKSFIYGLF